MKNYINKSMHERADKLKKHFIDAIDARLATTKDLTLNSVRGSIKGTGTVKNSYILGDVEMKGNSIMCNCIVDRKVTVVVEDGAVVVDCQFHPFLGDTGIQPVYIFIGKNSKLGFIWAAEKLSVGDNCIVFMSQFHDTGRSYGSSGSTLGIMLGSNCLVYGSYLRSSDDHDHPGITGVKVGDDSIIWRAGLQGRGKTLEIGKRAVMVSYSVAMQIQFKTTAITIELPPEPDTSIPEVIGNIKQSVNLEAINTDVIIGDDCYIGSSLSLYSAFEKLKNPSIKIGNNMSLVTQRKETRGSSNISLIVYRMVAGDNLTICAESDSWNYSRSPYRYLTIGDNCVLSLTDRGSNFDGTDKTIPSDTVIAL